MYVVRATSTELESMLSCFNWTCQGERESILMDWLWLVQNSLSTMQCYLHYCLDSYVQCCYRRPHAMCLYEVQHVTNVLLYIIGLSLTVCHFIAPHLVCFLPFLFTLKSVFAYMIQICNKSPNNIFQWSLQYLPRVCSNWLMMSCTYGEIRMVLWVNW